MGIDVENSEIFYNNKHKEGLNTSVKTNPQRSHFFVQCHLQQKIVVQSIFQRNYLHNENDGNPFIYALKGKKGYKISRKELCKFIPEFTNILNKAMKNKQNVYLVPVPSSHKISQILARRAAKIHNQSFVADIFAKKTNGEVALDLSQMVFSEQIKKDAIKLLADLKRSKNAMFAMKDVKNSKLREFINPIKLCNQNELNHQAEIILVDDLISSGATLVAAYHELRKNGMKNKITGLCLLSPR